MEGLNKLYGKLLVDKFVPMKGLTIPSKISKGVTFRHISATTEKRLGRYKDFIFEFKDDEVQWL